MCGYMALANAGVYTLPWQRWGTSTTKEWLRYVSLRIYNSANSCEPGYWFSLFEIYKIPDRLTKYENIPVVQDR